MEKEKNAEKTGFITLKINNINKELQGNLGLEVQMTLEQISALGIALGNAASQQNIENEAPLKILETLEDIVEIANFYKKECNNFHEKEKKWQSQYDILKKENKITITLDEFLESKSNNEGMTDVERFQKEYEKVRRKLKVTKIL